ncbi:MAG: HAD-IA family hydrolase [Actinobacteria bacterium]|nr:HAD-IA family hydrolase [Actinomycetota bacterium]
MTGPRGVGDDAPMRPTWVLFDLNGTLTDPSALGAPWGRPDLGVRILGDAVRGGMTDALTGGDRPFREHVRAAATVVAAQEGLDPDGVDAAMEAAAGLPAWPDARGALEALRGGGYRLAVLTNSGAEAGRATLEAAGLLDLFESVFGVDAVGTFKPDRRTYEHAVSGLDAAPGDVLLVAAHGWDVAGARAAGLGAAWIARGEVVLPPTTPEPDLTAPDLDGLAARLLAR